MQKILIIGSNGAGKSTFSYALAEKLNLPLIHIDQIYWRGRWDVTPRDEFERAIVQEAQKEKWIIEGNNIKSLEQRLPYADTVFWFEFPPLFCIFNIFKREWRYRGKVRPDMPDECVSKLRFSFLRYAFRFNKNNRTRIEELLSHYTHVKVIRFTGRGQVKKYLKSLMSMLH